MSESSKSAPAAANVEEVILGLKVELLADNGELIILELFERLRLRERGRDTGSVNHARTEEPDRSRDT